MVVYEYLLIFCFMYLCECLHICICTMCLTSAQRSQKSVRFHGSGLMGVVSTLVWVWVSRATTVINCWICLYRMKPTNTHTHMHVHTYMHILEQCFCVDVRVRGQLAGVGSLVAPCESWGPDHVIRFDSKCLYLLSHHTSWIISILINW